MALFVHSCPLPHFGTFGHGSSLCDFGRSLTHLSASALPKKARYGKEQKHQKLQDREKVPRKAKEKSKDLAKEQQDLALIIFLKSNTNTRIGHIKRPVCSDAAPKTQ